MRSRDGQLRRSFRALNHASGTRVDRATNAAPAPVGSAALRIDYRIANGPISLPGAFVERPYST
jgi:hypothetical protein